MQITVIHTSPSVELMVLPLGWTREFACTSPPGTDYVIAWKVNGTSASNALFEDYITVGEAVHLDIDVLEMNFTLTADARANNTLIQCDIYPFGGEEYTEVNMSIILQGKSVNIGMLVC